MKTYTISLIDGSKSETIEIDESQGFPDSDLNDAVYEYMERHGIEYTAENYTKLIQVNQND